MTEEKKKGVCIYKNADGAWVVRWGKEGNPFNPPYPWEMFPTEAEAKAFAEKIRAE